MKRIMIIIAIAIILNMFTTAIAWSQNLSSSEKTNAVSNVFNNIVRAYGSPYPKGIAPELIFCDDIKIALWKAPNKVYVENRFIDLCFDNFGVNAEDAIASILGHELTHYFEQHDASDFGFIDRNNKEIEMIMSFIDSKQSLNDSEKSIGRSTIRKIMEAQADRRGLFFGYVAGYNTLAFYEKLLDDIYQWYNLNDSKLEYSYYPKADRIKIADEQIIVLRDLLPIFDSANLLLATSRFEQAAICFDFLIKEFPSREMYNNSGLANLIAAYRLSDSTDVPNYKGKKLELPFSLSTNSRLSEKDPFDIASRSRTSESKDKIKALLDSAKIRFNKSIELDSSFFPAYVNMICLNLIENNRTTAEYYFEIAQRVAVKESDKIALAICKAIFDYNDGSLQKAKEKFRSLENLSYIAKINNKILNNEDTAISLVLTNTQLEFSIAGKTISDVANFIYTNHSIRSTANVPIEIGLSKGSEEWYAIRVFSKNSNEVDYFLIANKDYKSKISGDIGIGSSKESIFDNLKEPEFSLSGTNCDILVYEKLGLLVQIDNNQKVKGFVIY